MLDSIIDKKTRSRSRLYYQKHGMRNRFKNSTKSLIYVATVWIRNNPSQNMFTLHNIVFGVICISRFLTLLAIHFFALFVYGHLSFSLSLSLSLYNFNVEHLWKNENAANFSSADLHFSSFLCCSINQACFQNMTRVFVSISTSARHTLFVHF